MGVVRYYHLDYDRSGVAPDTRGPRRVTDAAEWQRPSWRGIGFHWADYGVEFETATGRVFSVTWDSPGFTEGIGVREMPMIGSAVVEDADVAVWDVSHQPEWQPLLGADISDVTPHYAPWHDGHAWGFWCARITVTFGSAGVELLLGEADAADALKPAADSIAVAFAPSELPTWAHGR